LSKEKMVKEKPGKKEGVGGALSRDFEKTLYSKCCQKEKGKKFEGQGKNRRKKMEGKGEGITESSGVHYWSGKGRTISNQNYMGKKDGSKQKILGGEDSLFAKIKGEFRGLL